MCFDNFHLLPTVQDVVVSEIQAGLQYFVQKSCKKNDDCGSNECCVSNDRWLIASKRDVISGPVMPFGRVRRKCLQTTSIYKLHTTFTTFYMYSF